MYLQLRQRENPREECHVLLLDLLVAYAFQKLPALTHPFLVRIVLLLDKSSAQDALPRPCVAS